MTDKVKDTITTGTAGNAHIVRTPATTGLIDTAAPGLLRNAIDERIVRVRPMSTPIDQLSRCGNARPCNAMTVEYYSVDTKQTEAVVSEKVTGGVGTRRSDDIFTHVIKTSDDSIFDISETILVPSVDGTEATADGSPLVLYVVARPESGGIEVAPVNGLRSAAGVALPAIAAGAKLVRMGRAAGELDVQTAQFAALPKKSANNCQIFKMQVEQSTFAKIAGKEAGWNFSDQEEAAIIDMRLGMEKSYLFGAKAKLFDPQKNEAVFFTGGIWGQVPGSMAIPLGDIDEAVLIELCRTAFTGNTGSKRKILIAGSELVAALSKIQFTRTLSGGDTLTKWGVEFKEIRSNFGSLFVLHSEVFDSCGHGADGLIVDPDYMTKYVHVPFHAETLDLRRSGVRNTDAVVLTEASCLVLRYPAAHLRVIGKP